MELSTEVTDKVSVVAFSDEEREIDDERLCSAPVHVPLSDAEWLFACAEAEEENVNVSVGTQLRDAVTFAECVRGERDKDSADRETDGDNDAEGREELSVTFAVGVGSADNDCEEGGCDRVTERVEIPPVGVPRSVALTVSEEEDVLPPTVFDPLCVATERLSVTVAVAADEADRRLRLRLSVTFKEVVKVDVRLRVRRAVSETAAVGVAVARIVSDTEGAERDAVGSSDEDGDAVARLGVGTPDCDRLLDELNVVVSRDVRLGVLRRLSEDETLELLTFAEWVPFETESDTERDVSFLEDVTLGVGPVGLRDAVEASEADRPVLDSDGDAADADGDVLGEWVMRSVRLRDELEVREAVAVDEKGDEALTRLDERVKDCFVDGVLAAEGVLDLLVVVPDKDRLMFDVNEMDALSVGR